MSSGEAFGLSVLVAVGFVRIVTNRKIYSDPTPLDVALPVMDRIAASPGCRLVAPSIDHLAQVGELCRATRAAGKLVADARSSSDPTASVQQIRQPSCARISGICCRRLAGEDLVGQTMSEECVIRLASPADYEATCVLFDELDALHREQLPWLFRAPADRPRSQDYFDELVSADRSSILVAAAGSIVGLATVRLQSAPEFAVFIPQGWGVIDDIVVVATWRRRGIGTRLTRAAENWAHEHGAAWVELGVYDFNSEARGFYEVLGYLPVSTKLRRPLPGAG